MKRTEFTEVKIVFALRQAEGGYHDKYESFSGILGGSL
jgi:hypothetical protein